MICYFCLDVGDAASRHVAFVKSRLEPFATHPLRNATPSAEKHHKNRTKPVALMAPSHRQISVTASAKHEEPHHVVMVPVLARLGRSVAHLRLIFLPR